LLLLLNPLRDREPERCAEAFLSRLRADCVSALTSELTVAQGEALRHTCEREAVYRLEGWSLRDPNWVT